MIASTCSPSVAPTLAPSPRASGCRRARSACTSSSGCRCVRRARSTTRRWPMTEYGEYEEPQPDKARRLASELSRLVHHHREACESYRRIVDVVAPGFDEAERPADVPHLPV